MYELHVNLFRFLVDFSDERGSFGKEIILRFETDLASKGEFFTDSNGRQDIKRM